MVGYGTRGTQAVPTGAGIVALIEVTGLANGCTDLRLEGVILADNSEPPRTFPLNVQNKTICVGAVACTPNETRSCYEGPAGTDGIGACHAGVQTCLPDGLRFGACEGQVLPTTEACNNVDDDCDGLTDT